MTSEEVIHELITTVSCNGNVLINVGPTKYGTILPIFEERLRDMGQWLKINGEAIYGSKPWKLQNDSVTPGVWYTTNDTDKDHTIIYAMLLLYPYDTNSLDIYPWGKVEGDLNEVTLIGLDPLDASVNKIVMLGMDNTDIQVHT